MSGAPVRAAAVRGARRAHRARTLARGLLALAVCACAGCGRRERPGLPPQNLLVVTVEDLRPDRMSAYAAARPTTWLPGDPTQRAQDRAFDLDQLARSGVVFARAYTPCAYTVPALVTLFSGCSPAASGVVEYSGVLGPEHATLAERLAEQGFECAAFVSYTPEPLALSLQRGFSTWRQCSEDAETLQLARRWVEERDFGAERPFFVWLHLGGLVPPYLPDPGREGARFAHPPPGARAARTREFLEGVQRGTLEPLEEDFRILEDLYDDALNDLTRKLSAFLTETFDFLLARAEVSETWSRTLFVLAGTSGTDLGRQARRLGHARHLCESELHVPLVLRHPDSLTGERVLDTPVSLADVAPTLLEWFGLAPSAGQTGRSLLALTDRGRRGSFEERPSCATLLGRIQSVRDERWRLVWDAERVRFEGLPYGEADPAQALLFDLGRRVHEERDVAAEHPEVVARLRGVLERWQAAGGEGP